MENIISLIFVSTICLTILGITGTTIYLFIKEDR
jgi:hypothetical protein